MNEAETRKPRHHSVKVWDEYYDAVEDGSKPFEARLNDRDYQVGDFFVAKSFDKDCNEFSGKQHSRVITFCLYGPGFGVQEGYVILGLSRDPIPF